MKICGEIVSLQTGGGNMACPKEKRGAIFFQNVGVKLCNRGQFINFALSGVKGLHVRLE